MIRPLKFIGSNFGLGGPNIGTASAPAKFRALNIFEELRSVGVKVEDGGDITCMGSAEQNGGTSLKNLEQVIEFCSRLSDLEYAALDTGFVPFSVGGDHSIALASIAAASTFVKRKHGQDANLGVIWVDAHPDLNTDQTSPSGNIHGMPLAAALGRGDVRLSNFGGVSPKIKPGNIVIIGAREFDEGEIDLLDELGVICFSSSDVSRIGATKTLALALDRIEATCAGYLLSFDVDVIDPSIIPAVGTPVPGGISIEDAKILIRGCLSSEKLVALDFVEYNPSLDTADKSGALLISLLKESFRR